MPWTDTGTLSKEIQKLSDREFADLLNFLLSETAARAGIARSCIAANLNIQEPDGGIDARCVNASTTAGRLIPRKNVDYQFKSGQSKKSVARVAKEDFRDKPRVLDGLKNGHAMVFACAWERGDAFEEELTRELRQINIPVEDGQVVFLTAYSIALLLPSYPSSLARVFGWSLSLVGIDRWVKFQSMSNVFQADASLHATIEALRIQIEKPKSITQVIGNTGAGRTRLVMETLRRSLLAPNVLYAREATQITDEFLSHLTRTPDVECTLVADDVDRRYADKLIDAFSHMPAGVRLIIIGSEGSNLEATVRIAPLSHDLLSAIVLTIIPGLSAETTLAIVDGSQGLPGQAIDRAQRVKAHSSVAGKEALTPDGLRYVQFDDELRRSSPTADYDRVKPCLFDLNAVMDKSKNAIITGKGLIGLGLFCHSHVLLKHCCDRLALELRDEKIRVLPPWGIQLLHRTVEDAVTHVLSQRNVLNFQDVLAPMQIPDAQTANEFWAKLRRNVSDDIRKKLIILMVVGEENFDLHGVVRLETPSFDRGHVYTWIRDVVNAMRWPPDFIGVWQKSLIDELPNPDSLDPEWVYLHLEETTSFIRSKPEPAAFQAELRRRGEIYGTPRS
jgi:hypothetical protein